MAKKLVQGVYGDTWVDVPDTPTPAPQKLTPIDVQTSSQVKDNKFTQNLLTPQEQSAQKVQAPVATPQPQQQSVASPVTAPSVPSTNASQTTARQDQSNQGVTNASVQGGQGQSVKPIIPLKSSITPLQNTQQTSQTQKQGINQQTSTQSTNQDDFYSPDNFLATGMTKDQYDSLDVNGKINALNAGKEYLQTRANVNDQAKFMQKLTAEKEYLQKQNALKVEATGINNENESIQSDQQLRNSMQAVNNLEQNLGFLGTGGRPAQFKQSIESMKFMLFDAQRKHDELVKMEANGQRLRDIGVQFDANEFQKTIDDMNSKLNDNVDKVIQQALSNFNSEMMLGNIDTPSKLNALTNKYLDSIDLNVTNMTNRQVGMLDKMITQYTNLAANAQKVIEEQQKKQAEYQKGVNTVNKDMSTVKGYYVDGNGSPIVGIDGKPIPIPVEAPMDPVFKDGYLIQFTRGADGKIVANPQKIMEDSDMDKIKLVLAQEELKSKQLENATKQGIDITQPTGGAKTVDVIKSREGFRDKAYQDSTGTWTIGYGFTNLNGKPVKPGDTMDRGTADSMLQDKIGQYQTWKQFINKQLSESQQAALTSFEYNLGSGIWNKNAMPIIDKINQGDLSGAANLMKQYSYSKGQYLKGLANRRNYEAQLIQDDKIEQPKEIQAPTPSELAMFDKGAQYIGKKGGLSKQRFDEISSYQQNQQQDILNTYEPTFKNESQSKSFEYANRMIPAKSILDNLESTWLKNDAWSKLNINKWLPDFLESPEYQQYDQAKRDFINATLRKESGATISDSEFANAEKQYFVQPGDKKEVIAQKQANRKQALKGFMQTSGPGNGKYLEAVEKQYSTNNTQQPAQPSQPQSTVGSGEIASKSPDELLKMYNK